MSKVTKKARIAMIGLGGRGYSNATLFSFALALLTLSLTVLFLLKYLFLTKL